MMVRCCPTTGCTVEELEVPRKMLASSMAPHRAPTLFGVVLKKKQQMIYKGKCVIMCGCVGE